MRNRYVGLPLLILFLLAPFLAGSVWGNEPQQWGCPDRPTFPPGAQPPWARGRGTNSASLPAAVPAWQVETVDSAGDVGRSSSLALDAEGGPHISYRDWTNKALKYAYNDGSGWITETVSGAGYINGGDTSLALDAEGRPHISYCAGDPAYDCLELRHAWDDGSGWITETVDGGSPFDGYSSSLALDAEARPHISYHAGMSLRYAYYDGTAWITETLQTGHTVGFGISLVLDAAGRPHISYEDLWDLMYTYYDGTQWVFEDVAVMGYGSHTSLALNAAGLPRIAYEAGGPPYGMWLQYASYDGQEWHIEGVDVGEYGQYVGGGGSLALDAEGHPHISYNYDGTELRYAHYDGTAWWIEPVESENGTSTSLVLDADGRAHISYYDGDLKYAYRLCTPAVGAAIGGPARLPVGATGNYTASAGPLDATPPVTVTWADGTMSPTVAYSWTVPGTVTLAVTASNPCGEAQGLLTVTVCQPLAGVVVEGPPVLFTGQAGIYRASPQPITATPPFSYTWDNGTVGPTATYSWAATGTHTLAVTASSDCGSTWGASLAVQVVEWPYRVYLPLVLREQ